MVSLERRTLVWTILAGILWVAIMTQWGFWAGLLAMFLSLTSFWVGTTFVRSEINRKAAQQSQWY